MNSQKISNKALKKNVLLRDRTSFHIGGRAACWFEPKNAKDLSCFLKSPALALPIFVIGAGSNLLIKDGFIKKAFIHLSAPDFNSILVRKNKVTVGAGTRIGRLVSVMSTKDLGGYEFLAGIPGTIGGALVMNAGARMDFNSKEAICEMKDIVESVDVLDREGRFLTLTRDDLKFSYRHSNLKPFVVMGATLQFHRADKAIVQERFKANLRERISRQDWHHFSAGSFFKNPAVGPAAGFLIDRCGLKGLRVKGAQVSEKHANFIINLGNAKSADVIKLMEIIKKEVYNRFKIKLAPEVEIVA